MKARFRFSRDVRNQTRGSFIHVVIVGLVMICREKVSLGDDNYWTVQKLNDNKPWDRFVDSPLSIRVEGRLGSSGSGQFRLLRCDAKFTVDNSKLKLIPPKSNVEIRGRFKKVGAKEEFAVDDLKAVPNYMDQFETKASKMRRPTSDDWNELGDWATERARFYEDTDLEKKANTAFLNAIEVEYKALKQTDADGRFLLAKKIADRKLSKRREMELIHEGFRVQWQAAQKAEPPDLAAWQKMASNIEDQLPGTQEPLKLVAPDLKETYDQIPVSTYQKASDDLRVQLHRLFYVTVIRKILLHNASNDGRDGDSIADQIDKLVPEEHAVAEKYRISRLAYRMANVATATRTEVEDLAAVFRKRNRNDEAKQALRLWIKSHESRLKGDGLIGRMQLAEEYLSLLNDETTAVEFLTEAYAIDANFEDVKSKLVSLGYRLNNGRWTKTNSTPREYRNSNEQSPTGISIGMAATGLRKMLGQPRSLARAITTRGITEVWSFGPAGSTALVIRLEQKGRDSEPKVTAFSGQ